MVHGVVSLRCPKCARPFLSLPQQQGAMVTCPHCAHSASMLAYPPASGPLGQGGGVSLPIQRRIIPPRPGVSAASAWPSAPEQAPAHVPQPQAQSPFPPAPSAPPSWPPVMTPAQSPFGVAPLPSTPPLEPVPHMPAFSVAPHQAAPPAHTATEPQAAPTYVQPQPSPEPPMRRGVQDFTPAPTWEQRAPKSRAPRVILMLLCVALVGGGAWFLLQPPLVAEFQAPGENKEAQPESPRISSSSTSASPASEKAPETATAPVSPAPALAEPEVRRAEPATQKPEPVSLDLVAAAEAASTMMKKLLTTNKPQERQALVVDGEEYAVDMREFFERSRPKLQYVGIAKTQTKTLPGQEIQGLFLVSTDKNPTQGALLTLNLQPDGGFLMDWPLFAETHERKLARFLDKPIPDPTWFHVVLRRSHGLELSEAERKLSFCVEIITTRDGSVPCMGRVRLDSPLGRFLEREIAWEEDYSARLLLQHPAKPNGESVIILDCEGAVTGAIFPTGSR